MWSPWDCCAVAALTQAGLLHLNNNGSGGSNTSSSTTTNSNNNTEVELVVATGVELRSSETSAPDMVPLTIDNTVDASKRVSDYVDRMGDLQITITSHRLVFFQTRFIEEKTATATNNRNSTSNSSITQQQRREARYLHLSNIFAMYAESHYFKSPKISLSTTLGDLFLVFPKNAIKQRDECFQQMQLSMTRKQWELDEKQQQKNGGNFFANQQQQRRRVGVDAVLTASKQRHEQAQQLTDTAFTGDVETLLTEATELVAIIHKYVATLDRQQEMGDTNGNNSSSGGGETSKEDTDRLVRLLQDMGMTLALNKADYQRDESTYYEQTARQLVDFMRPKLQVIPVMTLTDVYCLFNRARASHLLSPEDLLIAVQDYLPKLHLGMSVVTFPNSGLKVLQNDALANETVLAKTFINQCHGRRRQSGGDGTQASNKNLPTSGDYKNDPFFGSITALSVSRELHIPTVLAWEQLLVAERGGFLVRDETVEGVCFFANDYF